MDVKPLGTAVRVGDGNPVGDRRVSETGKNRGCDVRSHVMSDDVEGVG
jgi:hypothetical protein